MKLVKTCAEVVMVQLNPTHLDAAREEGYGMDWGKLFARVSVCVMLSREVVLEEGDSESGESASMRNDCIVCTESRSGGRRA